MHRAQQIVNAITTEHIANGAWQNRVLKQQALTLDAETELPAALIYLRPDDPTSEFGNSNMAFIDSLLSLSIVLIAEASTESALLDSLMSYRATSHIVMMADQFHGLAFVSGQRYRGADQPLIDMVGQRLIGRLETKWAIDYRMNYADPN